ncbi:MAG: hypothetical protein ACREOG_13830 [Gemmatimonadaceae bacterium]
MNRLSLAFLTLCSMLVLAPTVVLAQVVDTRPSVTRSQSTSQDAPRVKQAGISRAAIVEHTRQAETLPAGPTLALSQSRARRGIPLMVVGGAAFLAGLIIGDDAGNALAIGGAIVGLYGLYLWAGTQ